MNKILKTAILSMLMLHFVNSSILQSKITPNPLSQEWQEAESLQEKLTEHFGQNHTISKYLKTLNELLFVQQILHHQYQLESSEEIMILIKQTNDLLSKFEQTALQVANEINRREYQYNQDNESEILINFCTLLSDAESLLLRVGNTLPPASYIIDENQEWEHVQQWQHQQKKDNWLFFAKGFSLIIGVGILYYFIKAFFEEGIETRISKLNDRVGKINTVLTTVKNETRIKKDLENLEKRYNKTIDDTTQDHKKECETNCDELAAGLQKKINDLDTLFNSIKDELGNLDSLHKEIKSTQNKFNSNAVETLSQKLNESIKNFSGRKIYIEFSKQ